MFESLDEKFGVDHESPHQEPEPEIMEAVPESTELQVYVVGEKSAIDTDTDLARATLQRLMLKGERAVDEAIRIAQASEHPRAYEVAGALIKNISDVSRDLMEVHKARKVIDKPDAGQKTIIKNQNNFVGTTKDILKMIREEGAISATATVIAEK